MYSIFLLGIKFVRDFTFIYRKGIMIQVPHFPPLHCHDFLSITGPDKPAKHWFVFV